jgi:hypothetical protein
MPTSRTDKWGCFVAGVGLVLLVVAQEKLCPWLALATPERNVEAEAAAPERAPREADGDDVPSKSRQPLPHIVPDAPAPRWACAWHNYEERHTLGARDGVQQCGPRDIAAPACDAAGNAIDHTAWRRLEARHAALIPWRTRELTPRPIDPALGTSIWPVAPPTG